MPSVEERIIAGELPEEFIEQEEIVLPDNPLARDFARYTERVVKRLLGSDYDPQLHNFRILLTAQQEPNAFVISKSHPPVMAFSVGLLKLLQSEDQLAAVIAHELTHKKLSDHLGEHANSKLEELGSDLWGVTLLQNAGYRPKAMAEMLALLPDEKGVKTLASYMDVHPGGAIRVRFSENARNILLSTNGWENETATPLDDGLWASIKVFEQPSYMQERLRQANFEKADNRHKIDVISHLLETETLDPDSPYIGRRVSDLADALRSIRLDLTRSEEVEAFGKLADQMTIRLPNRPYKMDRVAGELYPIVYKAWQQAGAQGAPGQVGQLAQAMHQFITATNIEDATKAAQSVRLMSEVVDVGFPRNKHNRKIIDGLDILPSFKAPTVSEVSAVTEAASTIGEPLKLSLPWKRHMEWAQEDLEHNRSPDIQIVMGLMGITKEYGLVEIGYDQPQITHKKYGYERRYDNGTYDTIVNPSWGGYDPVDIHWSNDLDILGFKQRIRFWPDRHALFSQELQERFLASENARMAKRDAIGQEIANQAQWSLLDKPGYVDDFDRVVRQTGYAEESYELNEELKKLNWYGSYRSSYGARRDAILQDEHYEHTRRIAHFIEQNRDFLIPEISVVDGGSLFEKTFAEKLKILSVENPQIYTPLIRQFFNGKFSGLISELPEVSVGSGNSFPELLEESIERNHKDKIDLNSRSILELPVGLDPHHPYMNLVTDPDINIPTKDRILFLASTRYLKSDKALSPLERWNFDATAALGLPVAHKVEDLGALYSEASRHVFSLDTHYDVVSRTKEFFSHVVATETYRHLEQPGRTFNRDELIALEQMSRLGFISDMIRRTRNSLDESFRKTAQHELTSSTETSELIESYVQFSHYHLFLNHPDIRHRYEKEIAQRIDLIEDPEIKRKMTEKILLSHSMKVELLPQIRESEYKSSIADPEFREKISSAYVESLVRIYGKDDGSKKYEESVRPLIDDILQRSEGGTRFGILSMLADRMEMQKSLSYYIRDQIVDYELIGMKRQDGKIAFGEISIDEINRSNELRLATIDFIREPLTRETASRYVEAVKKYGNIASLLPGEAKQIVGGLKTRSGYINPEIEIDAAIQAHRNFWSTPLGVRTLYLEKIVFPVSNAHEGKTQSWKTFEENKKLVLDMTVPEPSVLAETRVPWISRLRQNLGWSAPPPPSQARIARDFVESYLGAGEESEQRLLLTAMLVANEPSSGKESNVGHNFGKSLRRILEATGPAGVKIAQAIHSHPATPEWLRRDMEGSKKSADLPFRWTVHDLIEKNGLESNITHVGPVLGAGAYGITVETHRLDGIKSATTFLRPNVRARANREFGVFEKAGQNFIRKHPGFTSVLDMIGQAKTMSRVETNMDLAAKQVESARQHYDGVTLLVDGKKFIFRAAPWLGHGKDYKEAGIISGQHFNDLLSASSEDPAYIRASAKALLTIEQKLLLSGKAFDHDRHGGQQKLEGERIGQFDHGAMALEAPTDHQKELMGRILGRALKEHLLSYRRTSVADALVHQIDLLSKNPEDSHFLIEIKRAFLAQNDFMKALSSKDVKAVVASVWSSSDVDPVIRANMKRALGPLSPFVMRVLNQQAKKANVQVLQEREQVESFEQRQIQEPSLSLVTSEIPRTAKPALTIDSQTSFISSRRSLARGPVKDYGALMNFAKTINFTQAAPLLEKAAHGAAAGLGVIGVVDRFNGQLKEDLKGDNVQAVAGITALTADGANTVSGLFSAASKILKRAAPTLSEGAVGAASQVAEKIALPLAIVSTGADVVAGIQSHDAERVAGAGGSFFGGILGGMMTGAAAGFVLGAETGPGAIITGIVGGVVGGIVGEKVAKHYLSSGIRWLMERGENTSPPGPGAVIIKMPLRPKDANNYPARRLQLAS